MKVESIFLQENEKRINGLYLYLLYGGVSAGILLLLCAKYILVIRGISPMIFLYLVTSLLMLLIPTYLHRKFPYSKVTKYMLVGICITSISVVNYSIAEFSDDYFMNYFWGIILTVLFYNVSLEIISILTSFLSFFILSMLFPVMLPEVFRTTGIFHLAVAGFLIERVFYLLFAGAGCLAITVLARRILVGMNIQICVNQKDLHCIKGLLQGAEENSSALYSTSQELSIMAENASASMEEMSATVNTITSEAESNLDGIKSAMSVLNSLTEQSYSNAHLVDQTLQLTEKIIEAARDGMESIKAMESTAKEADDTFSVTANSIDRLSEESRKINLVLDAIKAFTDEIELLSINATIEAARAAEHGHGFLVVASKIKSLSNQAHSATGEIRGIINTLFSGLDTTVGSSKSTAEVLHKGVTVVTRVFGSFTGIINLVYDAIELLKSIGKYMNMQTDMISRIDSVISNNYEFSRYSEDGMSSLNQVSLELSEMAQSISASAQQLQSLAASLNEDVVKYNN
jgi:methyl-accepting chemotaxis protein